jgi:hypothetical protein
MEGGGELSGVEYVLMTVACTGPDPSLADAARALSVPLSAIDKAFGVVVVDPERHLYAVQVDQAAIRGQEESVPYRGPFSNPRIETMRPKEEVKRKR